MLFQYGFFKFRLLPPFFLCLGILTHSNVQASSQTRLIKAIQTGNISKVERVLSESKTISFKVPNPGTFEDQDSLLTFATRLGNLEIVKLILEHSKDLGPDQQSKADRTTPLFIASQGGHLEIAKLLIDHGADPNTPRSISGATPLFIASQNGHADIVKLLIAYGVDPNTPRTTSGATPLFIAAHQGHFEIAKLLIAHGADPNITLFTTGTTPRLIASQKQHTKVEEFLAQAEILPALISMNEEEFLRLLPTVDRSEIVDLIHNYINWSYEGSQSARKVYSHFLKRLLNEMTKSESKKKAYQLAHGKEYQPSPAFQTLSEIVQKYLDYFSNSNLKTLCFHALDRGFKNIGNYIDENPKLSPLEAFNSEDSLFSNIEGLRSCNEPNDFDFSNVSPGISHHGTTLRQVMEKSADRHFKEN
jgi:hypothetical protein